MIHLSYCFDTKGKRIIPFVWRTYKELVQFFLPISTDVAFKKAIESSDRDFYMQILNEYLPADADIVIVKEVAQLSVDTACIISTVRFEDIDEGEFYMHLNEYLGLLFTDLVKEYLDEKESNTSVDTVDKIDIENDRKDA